MKYQTRPQKLISTFYIFFCCCCRSLQCCWMVWYGLVCVCERSLCRCEGAQAFFSLHSGIHLLLFFLFVICRRIFYMVIVVQRANIARIWFSFELPYLTLFGMFEDDYNNDNDDGTVKGIDGKKERKQQKKNTYTERESSRTCIRFHLEVSAYANYNNHIRYVE